MWAWILRAAVAVGLDKWAKRKAGELIAKAKDKLKQRVEKLEGVQKLVADAGGTAVFRSKDGVDYVVRFERRA